MSEIEDKARRDTLARVLFEADVQSSDPDVADRLWRNISNRTPETEWHRGADAALAWHAAQPVTVTAEQVEAAALHLWDGGIVCLEPLGRVAVLATLAALGIEVTR
jgi:hypothetical protein